MTDDAVRSERLQNAETFVSTRWSLVLAAGKPDSPDADAALQTLCEAYWYALYAFARRSGNTPDDAADRTQEFFARLLDRRLLGQADPDRGRFRSWLITAFKRFLINEWQREQAQKRGGGARRLSIDAAVGERRYAMEPADVRTPEAIYERRWALTVLEIALERVAEDYRERRKSQLFERCRGRLAGGTAADSCADIARDLAMSETAVRVAVHRMRSRYREFLMQEIAATLDERESLVDELERLRAAIRGENSENRA